MRSQIVKKIVAVVLCLYTSTVMFGQSSGGNEGPPPPRGPGDDPDGPGLPIDDNIEILLLLGLLYGCYIVYKKYRIKNTAA